MNFAVIKTGGKQYKVGANQVIKVEKLDAEVGDIVTFDQVLAVGNGDEATFGAPLVAGALVAAEYVSLDKQRTVIVFKKKRRHNYRRRNGHRQLLSTVRITEILTGGAQPSAKAAAPKAAAAAPAETKAAKPAKAPKAEASAAGFNDDLKLIGGVGPALEKKLNAAGVTSLTQIAAWGADDIAKFDAELNFKGRIERDEWVAQAQDLVAGKPPRAKVDQDSAAGKAEDKQ
ncbi:MAG: 50S ribosomal protein L21 [Devosia sp.]